MILDHVGIPVSDIDKSKAFYQKALAPLGIGIMMDVGVAVGLGKGDKPDFWIGGLRGGLKKSDVAHIAFIAESRALVDAFYEAAIAAGGRDNGKPGIRAQYHPNYYGAFVLDPDGNNIEAVCHKAEGR
jgi:catechol 2,3-dioxygenase-like lactoylglutathione lyase family enzyme